MPTYNKEIIDILTNAGIVAVPTDTVYGLAIDPRNKMALQKLYKIKQRDAGKPLVWMVADQAQLAEIVREIIPEVQKIIDRHWPGALTIIFKQKYSDDTIGIRIPKQKQLLGLLQEWQRPLAVTSANLSGEKELCFKQEVEQKFGESVDYYMDTAEPLSGLASTIIDVSKGEIKVLRQGEIKI